MASSATCSFFLLLTLLASLHVHARDSQFFSKVTTNNIPKEVLPTKELEPLNKPEQEPNFVPQNSGGYGLYGHESGQFPPTTENLPYKSQTENFYNKENNPNLVDGLYYNNDANSNNGDQYRNNDAYVTKPQGLSDARFMDNAYTTPVTNNNNGDQYRNNDAYVTKPQGLSDTRFMDNAYSTPVTNNNNGDQYRNNDAYVTKPQGLSDTRFMDNAYTTPVTNNNNDAYLTKPQGMSNTRFMDNAYTTPVTDTNNNYNGDNMNNNREHGIGEAKLGVTNGNNYNNGGNMYNNEKHGMSDTRVMENGKYYYDLDSEKNYNLNNYNENSRGFNSRTEYDNSRGNYGSSFKGQNGNNENFMEGYNGNQEEFQEIQDEQFMP